jgi:hypothetical protein
MRRRQLRAHEPCLLHSESTASIRQHTSAYVSIRQHTSAYVSIREVFRVASFMPFQMCLYAAGSGASLASSQLPSPESVSTSRSER